MSEGTVRQPYPFQGCRWSRRADSTREFYVTPDCLEAWNAADGVALYDQGEGEYMVGLPVARERLFFTPAPKGMPHSDYERAGLWYYVELSESSDGTVLFELFKAVGATYTEVGSSAGFRPKNTKDRTARTRRNVM